MIVVIEGALDVGSVAGDSLSVDRMGSLVGSLLDSGISVGSGLVGSEVGLCESSPLTGIIILEVTEASGSVRATKSSVGCDGAAVASRLDSLMGSKDGLCEGAAAGVAIAGRGTGVVSLVGDASVIVEGAASVAWYPRKCVKMEDEGVLNDVDGDADGALDGRLVKGVNGSRDGAVVGAAVWSSTGWEPSSDPKVVSDTTRCASVGDIIAP